MNIHRGEQYYIRIKVNDSNGEPFTPDTCDDIRIKIGAVLKEYSKETVTFDEETNEWLYWMTEDESLVMSSKVTIEVSIKSGDDIFKSTPKFIDGVTTTIKDKWND